MSNEAKFDIALKPTGGPTINPQSGVTKLATTSGIVVDLKPNDKETLVEGKAEEFGDEGILKFLAIRADKYKASICGKEQDAIRFRFDKGTWQLLSGPRVFVSQPGHEISVSEVNFEGQIELVDRNADDDAQRVRVFVTYGRGANFEDEDLPGLAYLGPSASLSDTESDADSVPALDSVKA